MAKKSSSVSKSSKKTTNNKTKNKPAEVKTKDTSKNNLKNEQINEKPSFMKKNLRLIVPAVVLICIIGLVFLAFDTGILGSDEAKAEIGDISGIVEIKQQGESWKSAEDGMLLYESDSIKTGDDSSATIILFKSSIVRLDSNTEVTLKEIQEGEETSVALTQDAGRTWSTIEKISGIDNYEIQTPTATASVRGTSFDVNVDKDGITIVSVIKGIVNVTNTEEGTVFSIQLSQNYSITVDNVGPGEPQTFTADEWISDNLMKDTEFIDDIKATLKARIEPYLDEVRALVDEPIPDDEIDHLIDMYVRGDFSIPPETPDHIKEIFDLS